MYTLEIRIKVEAILLPNDVTTLEQLEAAIESKVGNALERIVSSMIVQEVNLSQTERDWDALLRECCDD